jgi:hypothetical protein
MRTSNRAGGHSDGAAVALPVALVRYRPGVVGETARTVHVVPLPADGHTDVVNAVCGAALLLEDMETVTPGQGMPCTVCVLTHSATVATATGEPPLAGPDSGHAAELAVGGACYQRWGWPVTVLRDQVRLSLCREVSAVAIPTPLCTEVTEVLIQRQCAPAVLAHPYAREHRIVLTGERYGVMLPWPGQVQRITGALLLPPTATARGPISWTRPPQENSLRLCREIDLFGALRATLSDSASGDSPPASSESP